jgi:hypothetical protein
MIRGLVSGTGQFMLPNIMSTRDLIETELNQLPDYLLCQAYDFIRFLRLKSTADQFNGLSLSEAVLARDWNDADEDAAWANL